MVVGNLELIPEIGSRLGNPVFVGGKTAGKVLSGTAIQLDPRVSVVRAAENPVFRVSGLMVIGRGDGIPFDDRRFVQRKGYLCLIASRQIFGADITVKKAGNPLCGAVRRRSGQRGKVHGNLVPAFIAFRIIQFQRRKLKHPRSAVFFHLQFVPFVGKCIVKRKFLGLESAGKGFPFSFVQHRPVGPVPGTVKHPALRVSSRFVVCTRQLVCIDHRRFLESKPDGAGRVICQKLGGGFSVEKVEFVLTAQIVLHALNTVKPDLKALSLDAVCRLNHAGFSLALAHDLFFAFFKRCLK